MVQKISSELVEKMASLARLDLTAAEKELAVAELGRIVEYIDRLAEVETDGIDPYRLAAVPLSGLRDDAVIPFIDRARLLEGDRFRNDLLVTKAIFKDDTA